jgi:hypothetical protein
MEGSPRTGTWAASHHVMNADRRFLQTVGILVVFTAGRWPGLLGPQPVAVSLLTVGLALIAWRAAAPDHANSATGTATVSGHA